MIGSKASDASGSTQKVKRAKKRKSILPGLASDIDITEMEEGFVEDMDLVEEEEEEELGEEDELEEEGVLPVIVDEVEAEVEAIVDDDTEEVDDDDAFSDALDIEDVDLETEEE